LKRKARASSGPRKIGAVSRSQTSPKRTRDDLDPDHVAQHRPRRRDRVVAAGHQPHLLAADLGHRARQGGGLGLGGREVVLPELGMAREADPDGAVRRPFSGDEGVHGGGLDRNDFHKKRAAREDRPDLRV
jgi:hypothetical protein